MKKIMIVVFALCIALSLTACNSKEEDDTNNASTEQEKVEVTFWAHQEGPWNDSYEAIGAAYSELNPNVNIKFEFYPYDEFESKIQTSLISNSGGADIYEIWGGWGVDFASTGSLAAFPEEMAKEVMNDSYPSTYGSLVYDGKLYGVPMEFNIENGAMLVNLNVLNDSGLTLPTTWEELVKTAKKATVKNGNEFEIKGFDFVNWDSVTYLWISMILSNGGQYLNEDGTVDFTSDIAKEKFLELVALVQEEQVTDLYGLTGGEELEGYQQLYAGKVLFVPRGAWCIPEGIQTFELEYGKDFSYVSMPWTGPEEKFAAETGWSLAVNGESKVKEVAYDFLEYFYSDEVLLQHNINTGMIPPKKSVAQSEEYNKQVAYAQPLTKILDNAQYIGYFNTDVLKEKINDAFVDYCSGIYDNVDDALDTLTTDINNEIEMRK